MTQRTRLAGGLIRQAANEAMKEVGGGVGGLAMARACVINQDDF